TPTETLDQEERRSSERDSTSQNPLNLSTPVYSHSFNMAAHSYMPTIKRLYAMAQMLDLPVDFTESTTVRHSCTIFIVQVSVGNLWAESRGPNRREAKTRACGLALRLLDSHRKKRTYPNGSASVLHYSHPEFGLGKDPCTRLSELLMARKNPPAQYRLLEGTVAGDQWVFSMEVTVGQCTAVGKGGSKKEARSRACTAHLQIMGYKTTSRCVLPAHILPDFRLEKDPITRLSELQMIRREKFPEYRMISGELVNGSWMFTMEVSVDQYTASGSGPSKKEAKRSASTALLLMMGFTVPQKDLVQEKPAQNSPEEHLDTKVPEWRAW
uniref:DRBM domain-containing protein n=1 Tax=Periophthalmus magnuspinnatus TaxID=409849 RepID=A0A3B4BAC0_9GOBI